MRIHLTICPETTASSQWLRFLVCPKMGQNFTPLREKRECLQRLAFPVTVTHESLLRNWIKSTFRNFPHCHVKMRLCNGDQVELQYRPLL